MFANRDAAVRMTVLLLPVLLYAMPAASQSQDPSSARQRAEQSKVPRAPVGHRQPTAADIPKDAKDPAQAERDKRDRELDAKLQICRGC